MRFAKPVTRFFSAVLWFAIWATLPQIAFADRPNLHDFSREAWSGGKSCPTCHLPNPRAGYRLPPDAPRERLVLSPEERAAVREHPLNRICYECHLPLAWGAGHSDAESRIGDLNSGGQAQAPAVAGPSHGSVCLRVNSGGAAAGRNCLNCHEVHNGESAKLLRADWNSGRVPISKK